MNLMLQKESTIDKNKNKRIKSCVLLPAAGRRTQLFQLIFTEPGVCGFADPCSLGTRGYLEVGLMENGLKSFFRPNSSLEDWK